MDVMHNPERSSFRLFENETLEDDKRRAQARKNGGQEAVPRELGSSRSASMRSFCFSAGLFNASICAASILPLSTAYSVCEGLGFEAGVNKQLPEAPIFYALHTTLIVVGGGVVLIPNFPLVQM